jgi:hypothetical protein
MNGFRISKGIPLEPGRLAAQISMVLISMVLLRRPGRKLPPAGLRASRDDTLNTLEWENVMKMRASEISSAAIDAEGSLSIGFRSATDHHTLELSRKAQEQLLPALIASEPANLHKFFTSVDVQTNRLSEGVLLVFPIVGSTAIRVLVSESTRQKLLAQLTGMSPATP